MATFISHSAEETQAFAEALAPQVPSGRVIGLVGDLGAGKTQFVKGFARGLGVTEPVLSPSFALLHCYGSGRLPLYHLDFYRLETPGQVIAAGLDDYLTPAGVSIIEWWDRWRGPNPPGLWRFDLATLSATERRISYGDPGS